MKEFIEKLIGRLEEKVVNRTFDESIKTKNLAYKESTEIVNQLAEEYNKKHEPTMDLLEYGVEGYNRHLQEQYRKGYEDAKKENGWIPCSERLPEDCDNRFYMCIVENHEEDFPMFCQYDENYGFGFWQDIYDEHTFGFVDSEFKTNEELGYEKVIAWQPLPEPYQPKGE